MWDDSSVCVTFRSHYFFQSFWGDSSDFSSRLGAQHGAKATRQEWPSRQRLGNLLPARRRQAPSARLLLVQKLRGSSSLALWRLAHGVGPPLDEDGQVHLGPVEVEARACPAPEPEHLRERHEVPLLVVEGAVAEVRS